MRFMPSARWRPAVGLAAICGLLAGCGGTDSQRAAIRVTPATGLYDKTRSVVISRLTPGETVTVAASTPRPDGLWAAKATFAANSAGTVDLRSRAPASGSYRDISPMGLLTFEDRVRRISADDAVTVTTLTVSAGGRRLASARLTQRLRGPGVAEHVENGPFVARFFTPRGGGRRPAVVLWGGSDGAFGDASADAELLASHGIPALALAYFDEPGLPCSLSDIPLEYFVRAIRWLRAQPDVDPRRVWTLAYSRGSEAELLVAAHWPGLVHGLVAASASSVVYGSSDGQCPGRAPAAWTYRGKPLPQAAVSGYATVRSDGSLSDLTAMTASLTSPTVPAARIPVAAFTGPVLLVTGGDDQVWPSGFYADQIMTALRAEHAPHLHLSYPLAGHRVLAIPYQPALTETRQGDIVLDLGGTRAADNAAYISDWPATISFIAHH